MRAEIEQVVGISVANIIVPRHIVARAGNHGQPALSRFRQGAQESNVSNRMATRALRRIQPPARVFAPLGDGAMEGEALMVKSSYSR